MGWRDIFRMRLGMSLPAGFDETEYLRLNPDVAKAAKPRARSPGAKHWLKWGRFEDRRWATAYQTSELPPGFNRKSYVRSNPDITATLVALRIDPAQHWLVVGRREGRTGWAFTGETDPVPAIASDRRSSEAESLQHPSPVAEVDAGDLLRNGFQADTYASLNSDVVRGLGDSKSALADHWLRNGLYEGRAAIGLKPYADRTFGEGFTQRADAITLYGFFDSKSGLATVARSYLAALVQAGFPVQPVTITEFRGVFETSPDVRAGSEFSTKTKKSKVNIFVFNADMAHRFFLDSRLHLLNDMT